MMMPIQRRNPLGLGLALLCLILAATGSLHGQATGSPTKLIEVRLDPGVQDTIDKRIVDNNGVVYGSITFQLYVNDSLELDFASLPQNIGNMTFLGGDTLKTIALMPLFFFGLAVQVRQYADDPTDFMVFASSHELPLRMAPGDTASKSLVLPCRSSMLTIPREPEFVKGATVSGILAFETEDFLVDDPEMPELQRLRIAMTWYFRTEAVVTD